MTDDIKSSATVWGGKVEDAPPAYSGDSADESLQQDGTSTPQQFVQVVARRPIPRTPYDPLRRLAPLSSLQFQKYNIPDGIVSPDKISLTVKHSDLYAHPQHLLPFILEQAYLPPKPTLRIVGTHWGERVDFDITINLTHLLELRDLKWSFNSAQVTPLQGGRAIYAKDDPTVPARVADLVKQFCQDKSENKSFCLRRKVQGLPTENLAGQVRNLAASVRYRGVLRIDFIDERSQVIVHKQPSSWFSNVLRLHTEKKYDMLETVWRLSDGSEGESGESIADMGLRAGHEWWQSWSGTIRNAIITRRKGTVGIDDWLETRMGHYEPLPKMDWGPEQHS